MIDNKNVIELEMDIVWGDGDNDQESNDEIPF